MCWLVWLTGLYKNYGIDFQESWLGDGSRPRIYPLLTFGADLDRGTDSGIFFSLSITLQEKTFFKIFVSFSGSNAWSNKVPCI